MRCEDVRYAMSSLDWGRRENDEAGNGVSGISYKNCCAFQSRFNEPRTPAGLSSEKPMVRLRCEEPEGAAPE
jgi:hypothetical protein